MQGGERAGKGPEPTPVAVVPKPLEVAPFLTKVYDMVSDPTTGEAISWSDDGGSFVVWDSHSFERDYDPSGAPLDQMGARYPHMLLIVLLPHGANAASHAPVQKWQTLGGLPPVVIARGGFSGLFPDSSQFSYQFALSSSLPDVVLYCDLQLSSDGMGFCKTGLTLENSTLIAEVFPKRDKTYKVNGEDVHGWFSLDFTSEELYQNVTLIQNIFSRPSTFDGSLGMYMLDDVVGLRPPQLWVNVEYDLFFQEHKLSSEDYILALPKQFSVTYISLPEIAFLKSLGGKLKKSKAKLIFRFLSEEVAEPSTKKTYGEIMKDLKSIKVFASGILVPKYYIWPLNKDQYLEPPTRFWIHPMVVVVWL